MQGIKIFGEFREIDRKEFIKKYAKNTNKKVIDWVFGYNRNKNIIICEKDVEVEIERVFTQKFKREFYPIGDIKLLEIVEIDRNDEKMEVIQKVKMKVSNPLKIIEIDKENNKCTYTIIIPK
jgi:hypothetical protein